MKKYYQYFGLALIMVFSFYYTEKIASIVLNKNPLMQSINDEAHNYNTKFVNAEISDEYIMPGLNGLEVNVKESFYKMQVGDVFNKYYLVFNQVKPQVSIEDHKDKIIKNGNYKLKKISLVLETDNEVSEFLKSNNIKASILTSIDSYKKNNYFEVINNEVVNFKALENTLNLNKENKHICVLNDNNKDICLKHKNYLIEPTYKLTNTNLIDIKKNILNGNIILITKTASLSDVKILLKEINYKDLESVFLSEIISEENDN